MLGGSAQQVIAIKRAKEMGLRTVLCDYLDDNPGQHYADSFYLVSTTDKEAVLRVAIDEAVDAVVAYSSDPAAPTAAYVANKLNLSGLPYAMSLNFCEKHRFRRFLEENDFSVPRSRRFDTEGSVDPNCLQSLSFPLIVKPTDSSGSKGVTVVRGRSMFDAAYRRALEHSRNGVVIAEEYIERDHAHVIEAELLVNDGRVITWGLINSIRDAETNALLPAAYSYPLEISESQRKIVESEIEKLVQASGMNRGAFNIEMIIDANGKLYFLDAGPRNGGNMLPDFISMIAGGDVPSATIRMCLGESPDASVCLDGRSGGSWGLVVLHSGQPGKFDSMWYSDAVSCNIVEEHIFVDRGDPVSPFDTCNDLVGLLFLHFPSEIEKRKVMNHLDENISVLLMKDAE